MRRHMLPVGEFPRNPIPVLRPVDPARKNPDGESCSQTAQFAACRLGDFSGQGARKGRPLPRPSFRAALSVAWRPSKRSCSAAKAKRRCPSGRRSRVLLQAARRRTGRGNRGRKTGGAEPVLAAAISADMSGREGRLPAERPKARVRARSPRRQAQAELVVTGRRAPKQRLHPRRSPRPGRPGTASPDSSAGN